MTGWDTAVGNFVQYLPDRVRHWVVALTPGLHDRTAAALLPRLGSSEIVVLAELSPRQIRELVAENADRADVGLLEFGVPSGERPAAALACLDTWPAERRRRCPDVWDANFTRLFAESPVRLADRCAATVRALDGEPLLAWFPWQQPDAGPAVTVQTGGAGWTARTGLGEPDQVLPSGAVACRPHSVDGELAVDGWLVGSIPFGLKYGRIRPGELVLGVAAGRVTHVTGSRPDLVRDVETALHRVPELQSVGEVGLGQSLAVVGAAGLHRAGCRWHARHIGLHLRLGAPDGAGPHSGPGPGDVPPAPGRGRPRSWRHSRVGGVPPPSHTAHHLHVVLATGSLTGGPSTAGASGPG